MLLRYWGKILQRGGRNAVGQEAAGSTSQGRHVNDGPVGPVSLRKSNMKKAAIYVPNLVTSETLKQVCAQHRSSHLKYETLVVTTEDNITTIRMNRPQKKNAVSSTMTDELIAALEEAATDDSVLTVLTGTSDYFTSGSDLTNALERKEQSRANINPFRIFVKKFIDFPKPLIAVVNGPAIGIGVTILGLFDVVYATERATFLTPFTKLAIYPEGCSSYTFPKIMGPGMAAEMLLFNKKLTAHEACNARLVTEVFPDDRFQSEVWTRLKAYAKLPKNCIAASKQLIRDVEREKLHDVCDKECELIDKRTNSKESSDAIKNFFKNKAKL
uniref:Enoyl-CoA delta isomerase 2, mitochondrial n=1 Tax=Leptobrachium leishanense TaxID=445787 RepID=A0A8C5PBP7_9ANUR